MKRGSIIVYVIIGIILLAGIFILIYPKDKDKLTNSDINCALEGEQIDKFTNNLECCEGLKRVNTGFGYKDSTKECGQIMYCDPVNCPDVCINCGNDICEEWENQCNCPEDCK